MYGSLARKKNSQVMKYNNKYALIYRFSKYEIFFTSVNKFPAINLARTINLIKSFLDLRISSRRRFVYRGDDYW